MKKMIPFLLVAMCFSFGFSAEVFAAEDMGLGKRAAAQLHRDKAAGNILLENSGKNVLLSEGDKQSPSRVRIFSPVCTHEAFVEEYLAHVYKDGKVESIRVPTQKLRIRVPCPDERKVK